VVASYDQAEMPGRLFDAARAGDVGALAGMLDRDPELLQAREPPYDWTLLHAAAAAGHLAAVELLLTRGLDVNVREAGENTYAMHWAAAAGHLDVAEFLVSRGARHHIVSAIAMNLDAEVRRIVAADPGALSRRLSRNEDHQQPLHFAVRKDRAEMVAVLVELGADPLGVDGSGHTAAAYASSPAVDLAAMEAIHAMTAAELVSAARGQREPSLGTIDLVAALALGDIGGAERLFPLVESDGALHLMAKRGDAAAVGWLLDRGADPNDRRSHWGAEVTPLHLGASRGHAHVVHLLLEHGADPDIRDSTHDSDVLGWAEFFQQSDIVEILRRRPPARPPRPP
jgi:ankyrin repeat protein